MLDESEKDVWLFRRQPRIARPLGAVIRRNADGIPYLSPEIQLLYKARSPRARDQADCDLIAPLMDANARAWLKQSLRDLDPEHEWIKIL